MTKNQQRIEIVIHILFWLFIFTFVNVDWTSDWFDKSIRERTPAPLIVLIFPIWFYANAFWLIPKYLVHKKWLRYLFFFVLVFFLPELIRAVLTSLFDPRINFFSELQGRDSFLFGAPSPFFLVLNFSFGYRFSKDWILNRKRIEEMKKEKDLQQEAEKEKANRKVAPVLPESEAIKLLKDLKVLMDKDKPYLNAELTLGELAKELGTTDKKLSYVLNQKLETNFYTYLNSFRIEAFKAQVGQQKNQTLSLVGIAKDCGFKSKSSFYRAFKSELGMSPTDYIKSMTENS